MYREGTGIINLKHLPLIKDDMSVLLYIKWSVLALFFPSVSTASYFVSLLQKKGDTKEKHNNERILPSTGKRDLRSQTQQFFRSA